jgi:hypothetical protein
MHVPVAPASRRKRSVPPPPHTPTTSQHQHCAASLKMSQTDAVNGLNSQLNDLKMSATTVHEDLEVRPCCLH